MLDEALRPDVIFLDLNMPLMNGKQFLQEIKRVDDIAGIPVTILSTSSDPHNIAETQKLGATGFITKPDRFSEWQAALKKFFTNHFSISNRAS